MNITAAASTELAPTVALARHGLFNHVCPGDNERGFREVLALGRIKPCDDAPPLSIRELGYESKGELYRGSQWHNKRE